jgi:hypothetical protein
LLPGGTTQAADPCTRFFQTNHDRKVCRGIRKRCKRAGTNFCIVEGNPTDPAKLASCCHRGESCCAYTCCGEMIVGSQTLPSKCCPGNYGNSNLAPCCPKTWECCADDAELGCCETRRGFHCCPGLGCIDTAGDSNNCGGCGIVCRSGQACVSGQCQNECGGARSDGAGGRCSECPAGQTECPMDGVPPGWWCVDTSRDPRHCGGCGNACPADSEHCYDGTCHPCPPGGKLCRGICIRRENQCCPAENPQIACGPASDGWLCCRNSRGGGYCARNSCT